MESTEIALFKSEFIGIFIGSSDFHTQLIFEKETTSSTPFTLLTWRHLVLEFRKPICQILNH